MEIKVTTNGVTFQARYMYMFLILMLVVVYLTNTNDAKKLKMTVTLHMDTHQNVSIEGFPMNTKMAGIRPFSKMFASVCFGRQYPQHWMGYSFTYELNLG